MHQQLFPDVLHKLFRTHLAEANRDGSSTGEARDDGV
jgi:hypothetical protein